MAQFAFQKKARQATELNNKYILIKEQIQLLDGNNNCFRMKYILEIFEEEITRRTLRDPKVTQWP